MRKQRDLLDKQNKQTNKPLCFFSVAVKSKENKNKTKKLFRFMNQEDRKRRTKD